MFKKPIVGFGCSFVRNSIDAENPNRLNIGAKPTRPLVQNHSWAHSKACVEHETSFIIELAEKLKVDSKNYAHGGSGVRSAIHKVIQYVDNNDASNEFIIIGITTFVRFDIIRPSLGLMGVSAKYPKLSDEEYAKYYDRKDAGVEITTLLKLLHMYLDSKGIEHIFINTLNYHHSTKDIVPTFIFPCGSEYWTQHIINYDENSRPRNHPNISDHQILSKYLFDALSNK